MIYINMLTATTVKNIFLDCLFREEEINAERTGPIEGVEMIQVEGVRSSFGFHKGRLESHKAEINAGNKAHYYLVPTGHMFTQVADKREAKRLARQFSSNTDGSAWFEEYLTNPPSGSGLGLVHRHSFNGRKWR